MFFLILLAAATVLLYYYLSRYQYSQRNLPPGPFRIPFVGNIFVYMWYFIKCKFQPWVAFDELSNIYGDVYSASVAGQDGIAICSYEAMQEISDQMEFSGKATTHMSRTRSFGKELGLIFVANSDIWQPMRKFSQKTLREYGFGKRLSMQGVIEAELTETTQEIKQILHETNGILKIETTFMLSILNVLWSMIAGVRYSHENPELQELLQMVFTASKTFSFANPLLWVPHLLEILPERIGGQRTRDDCIAKGHAFSKKLIQDRLNEGKYLSQPENYVDAFLQTMSTKGENEQVFTEEQLMMMIEDFLLVGAMTTNATLNYAILFMVLNPDVQKRVQEEIDSHVPRCLMPTLEDIEKMPYTQATILEIHRLACVVPNPIPRVMIGDAKFRDWKIPKGTYVFSNHYSVMMDKKHWGDPETFRPDRFMNSEGNFVPDKRVIHFGMGKRYCIGFTLADSAVPLYFSTLLQTFTFQIVPWEKIPSTEPEVGASSSPYAFNVLVTPRS